MTKTQDMDDAQIISDRDMERVYRLTSVIGHRKAILEIAGGWYDEEQDLIVPNLARQAALKDRYDAEMAEFAGRGGY